ncbi:MAG: hypothetical protein EBR82_12460 [Caulobacteraceae bacterium]|nr:hypothetical protein [Caulobacteraceae bacterium]
MIAKESSLNKVVDQIRDEYGNLLQLWGVYECKEVVLLEEGMVIPRKKTVKKLLRTCGSLVEANSWLDKKV